MNEAQSWLNDKQALLMEKWRAGIPIGIRSKYKDYKPRPKKKKNPKIKVKKCRAVRPVWIEGEDEWKYRQRCLTWLGFKDYKSYQESSLWRRIRRSVFERQNHKCWHCDNDATLVHHKRYTARNLDGTSLRWLFGLCRDCHAERHPTIVADKLAEEHLRSIG